jgi:hypothetical protein
MLFSITYFHGFNLDLFFRYVYDSLKLISFYRLKQDAKLSFFDSLIAKFLYDSICID